MELIVKTFPTYTGEVSVGNAEKVLVPNDQLKIQIVGPSQENILLEGPPAGKNWLVTISVFVKETNAE